MLKNEILEKFAVVKIYVYLIICEDYSCDVTIKNYNRFKHIIFKKFLGTASVIYINNNDNFFVICKNQTCSEKLKNLDELENYIKNNLWNLAN